MTLAEMILAKLDEIGLTQADLAKLTRIPKQNLGAILKGTRPLRTQHLIVIEAALGLDLDLAAVRLDEPDGR